MKGEIASRNVEAQLFEGAPMTLGDAFKHLMLSGRWTTELRWLGQLVAVEGLAREGGIAVSDDELQAAVDAFRRRLDLLSAEDTSRWLTASGMTLEDLEKHVELLELDRRLRARITPEQVQQHYAAHPELFGNAGLDIATSQRVVDALMTQVVEAYLARSNIRRRNIWA